MNEQIKLLETCSFSDSILIVKAGSAIHACILIFAVKSDAKHCGNPMENQERVSEIQEEFHIITKHQTVSGARILSHTRLRIILHIMAVEEFC